MILIYENFEENLATYMKSFFDYIKKEKCLTIYVMCHLFIMWHNIQS